MAISYKALNPQDNNCVAVKKKSAHDIYLKKLLHDDVNMLLIYVTITQISLTAFNLYQNPSLAVDLAVFGYHENMLSLLLLNRKEVPFKDHWTLPGAFLQMDETFRDTCARTLKTKLGINNIFLEQLYSFDEINRDPKGRVIAVTYYALVNPSKFKIIAGSMANDVQWFAVYKLPNFGFDHEDIFKIALQRLRSKILYYPVGFHLLDEFFTMPELHTLYECILGTPIYRRNFRRKILDPQYTTNSGTKRDGQQNRHPDLYKFNKGLQQNHFKLNINPS